jgi:hypothetical protein
MKARKPLQLVAVVAIIACLAACPKQTAEKAATVSHDFAVAVYGAQQAEIAFHQQGKIDNSEHQKIQQGFLQLSKVGPQVDAAIVAGDKQGIIVAIDSALASLKILLDEGVGNVHNPDSKAAIEALLLTAQASLNTAKALVQ